MAATEVLLAALEAGDLDSVQSILDDEPFLVNDRDERGSTPLQAAVGKNDMPMVRFLLSRGAEVNAHDMHGFSVLHLVQSAEMAELLLQEGAELDRPNNYGLTPLHIAVVDGLEGVVSCLLRSGARFDVRDRKGFTPLGMTIRYKLPAIEKMLRDSGAVD